MKSIKEQANEYADNHGFRVPYDGSDNFYDDVDVKASKEGFMAGANAVLEEIENSLQEFSNYEDSLIISRIIEQLKK